MLSCRSELMDKGTEKRLAVSVRRILENADMNLMTESKVRRLAAEDTGLDLNLPGNRKVVKRIIEEFFAENDEEGNDEAAESGSEEDEEEGQGVEAEYDQSKASGKQKRRLIIDEESDESKDKPPTKKRTSAGSPEEEVKSKKSARKQRVADSEEEDEQDEEASPEKGIRAKKKGKSTFQRNDDGDLVVCQLGSRRLVTLQKYKGNVLVSIREYYEKDGKQLPTAKGINLTVEQWEAFKKGFPDIEAAIKRIQRALVSY